MRDAERVRVAIVDDHTLFRVGLREIIEDQYDMEVVGEAGDSDGALALLSELRPDVMLLDVSIPGQDVTATVKSVRELSPATRVVILSMQDDADLVRELIVLGVRCYLHKSASWDELMAAIRMAHLSTNRVMVAVSPETLTQMSGGREEPIAAQANQVSARELEVLELVAHALSNAQIAAKLGLTEATVKRHLHNIFVKLGAVSRIDAVNKAVASAVIPDPR